MMKINSIRFRATVLYSAVLAVILLIFSLAVLFYSYHILRQRLDRDLEIKAKELKAIFNAYENISVFEQYPFSQILQIFDSHYFGGSTKTVLNNLWQEQFKVLDLKNDYINILNDKAETFLCSRRLSQKIVKLIQDKNFFNLYEEKYITFVFEGKLLRGINLPIIYHKKILVIQIYTSLNPVTSVIIKLIFFNLIVVFFIILIAGYMGRLLTFQILKPVASVTSLAENISHRNLNLRIEDDISDVEMKMLVKAFNDMIERLQKSFSYINDFSSQVAHELKTPLAIMRGELELALDNKNINEQTVNILSECLLEIDRMLRVINDLLILSKLENQEKLINPEKIDMQKLLVEIYESAKVLALPKNINVDFICDIKNTFVFGNREHLRRLFLNLISNAVKFTHNSGKVCITAIKERKNICIKVEDSGIGIAEDDLKCIFNKFFRVADVANEENSGTGLGLCIALTIAKIHKGNIIVESEINKGTVFKVFLPYVEGKK